MHIKFNFLATTVQYKRAYELMKKEIENTFDDSAQLIEMKRQA